MYVSHAEARELFDMTVESYQERAVAKVYNFSSFVFQRRINIVNSFVSRIRQGGKVLDYGMGPAVFARPCLERDLSYLGIDISPKMVDSARQMDLPNAEFVVGDLETLRDYQAKMDGVLAIGLLDYLESPEQGVELLAKCVKPGGYLILSIRNRISVPRILRDSVKKIWQVLMPGRSSHRDKAFCVAVHERSFTFSTELCPLLEREGFGNFEMAYFNCSPFFFNFPIPSWLWRRWVGFDSLMAKPLTSLMCSGGVMIAQRIN